MINNEAELGEVTKFQKVERKDSSQVIIKKASPLQRKTIWLIQEFATKRQRSNKVWRETESRAEDSQVKLLSSGVAFPKLENYVPSSY